METRILDSDDVTETIALPTLIDAVERAFVAYGHDNVQMPAKSYIELAQYDGDFRAMPAYVDAEDWEGAAIKWVNSHPNNPERFDLPTVMGVVIYSDPETAVPLAIMDGTELTRLRTGAAAAVATDYLAIDDATSLGIVGAGVQSYAQLNAIATVRDLEEIIVAEQDQARLEAFIDAFSDRFDVRAGSIADAAACDILSTVTPVREPIVDRAVVGDHTHINAVGADAAGKQELDEQILQDATIVIDDYEQCTHSGEINVAYQAGRLTDDDIYADLAAIVTAEKRVDTEGLTVFDSTGLAIQDVAAAHTAYEGAVDADRGETIELLTTA